MKMALQPQYCLSLEGVSKAFGGVQVVREVTCGMEAGAITGLIGPNGAGKTTLLDIISGMHTPDSGRVFVDGRDITDFSCSRRGRSGLTRVFQGIRAFGSLNVRQNLELAARGSPNSDETTIAAAREFLADVTGDVLREESPIAEVPYAVQKVLPIAMGLARNPRVLLLDEPTVGLDFSIYQALVRKLRDASTVSRACIVLVEHNLDVIKELASSVLFLAGGRLLKQGSFAELSADEELRRTYFGV
jgi:branched-chain amino acid transport system ATP-binding protein